MAEKKLFASQVAARMGPKWSRSRVHVEYKRGTFPQPVEFMEMGRYKIPLWTEEQVNRARREKGLDNEE